MKLQIHFSPFQTITKTRLCVSANGILLLDWKFSEKNKSKDLVVPMRAWTLKGCQALSTSQRRELCVTLTHRAKLYRDAVAEMEVEN